MTLPLIIETKPEDWTYVSEGGATIVFSYRGPHNVQFSDHVLRLRKVAHGSSNSTLLDSNSEQPDDSMIAFQENIISKLVPSEFLPSLVVVVLDEDWLRSLVVLRNGDRPAERRQTDHIDVRRSKGVLATDLIGGTPIAMEIKPKWGFLPTECHLSPETAALKTTTCRFCMHTSFRMEQGGIGTTYCPLDLFSRDETRIRKALGALWAGWYESHGSLNNLRLFVEGRMAKPDDDHSMQLLAHFLTADESTDVQNLRESFTSALAQALLDSPVLPLLSTLQRTLDILDVEGLSKLYTQTSSGSSCDGLGSLVPDPYMEEWEDFVEVYQSDHHSWDHTVPSPGHIRYYLMAYLLSATFKDCSIIIRPKSTQIGSFDTTIIDMDIKSMDRLGKWERLDRKIVEHYKSSGSQRRCIDSQRISQSGCTQLSEWR
ncbi:inositol-pentakisphosphate 2-kinase [Suillus subalutaceus]|uniref:inositol-pentakisphosphate 2-kinase n=1 Tax=Suillus subalutaceus TaxID=48586 RepID=UPI001B85CC71|nr:inositol-pentakisphosphate 2-kinase [Suillus subalutaceus]KAG1852840.1 inositol-pentakisphosphate 2-kinase [Suillus subalutaceus]